MVTEVEIRVKSTDMDADGIVNNARYLEYFEQARLEHLVAIGLVKRPRPPGELSRSFTIVEATCRYQAPARHLDVLLVRARTERVGNRSFSLRYEIVRGDERSTVASGSSAQVWLDAEGRPATLNAEAREALLGSLEEQPVG